MNDTSSRRLARSSRTSSDDVRRAAFWKGLPAAVLAVLGLSALVFANDRSSQLEQRYRRWAEDASKKRTELTQNLINELRLKRVGNESVTSLDELIPPDDERRVALEKASANERIFYEKLISLNSTEPEYRFQFALSCINSKEISEQERGLLLMNTVAPQNSVGYYKGHLFWAEHFSQLVQMGKIPLLEGAQYIYSHAEFCLRRNTSEKQALLLKGQAAMLLNRNDAAYESYSALFDKDPLFFIELVRINNRLNRTQANTDIYRSAKSRIESKLREDLPVDLWVRNWECLMMCMAGLKEHEEGAARLRREIERQTLANNSINRVFLEQLLARTLISHQNEGNPKMDQFTQRDLDLMAEAYQLDAKNPDVLRTLTRIALSSDPDIAKAGRQIYDPEADSNPPSIVLNEMGTVALSRGDYPTALNYLERARQLDPRNWMTLNNLAYVHLVSENRNPDRALKLVDDAIRLLPDQDTAKSYLTFFLHTKGSALMQLNRMPEAIAAFELAIQDRPDNIQIIESLITCYEASNLSADAYKERLKKLSEKFP
jgi:tetratricopeptide (TPR) repeat protein